MNTQLPKTNQQLTIIRVLIADDSHGAREIMKYVLESDPHIQVVGLVSDGIEAVEMTERIKPNVIIMDISMPKMNGFQATCRIMETYPIPIVLVSDIWDPKGTTTTFKAMEAGAVTVLEKPLGEDHPNHEKSARELIRTTKIMSEVKMVKRRAKKRIAKLPPEAPLKVKPLSTQADVELVAIGASTGGPRVLQTIISELPKDFPVPILIVQHIAAGFLDSFIDWLDQHTDLSIHLATNGERPLPGHVYFAPDDFHMEVSRNKRILLSKNEEKGGLCPSVAKLFSSVADIFGANATGVLLTGMGKDGAWELKLMKEKGAVTIAQDEKTSVVFGMPGQAVKDGAAQYILPPDQIVEALLRIVQ